MKSPRVLAKAGYFWIDYYLPGRKNSIRRSTGIELDIIPPPDRKPPVKYSADSDWWKKSKHAPKIRAKIKNAEEYRFAVEIGVQHRPTEQTKAAKVLRTWDDLLSEFNRVNELESDKKSKRTIEQRDLAIRFFRYYYPTTLPQQVTREIALQLREKASKPDRRGKSYAPKSLKNYFQVLRTLYRYGIREGYFSKNPFADITIKTLAKDPNVVDLDIEYQLFEFTWRANRELFFQTMFQRLTGFRVSEVCNFLGEYLNQKDRSIDYHNPKGGRIEKYPISKAVAALLELMGDIPVKGYVFAFRNRKTVGYYIGRACEYAGIEKVSTHQFKRSYAQEIDPVCPSERVFDMLMHHVPRTNIIAVRHYSGRNIDQMRTVLDEAQSHWIAFFKKLKRLPDNKKEYTFSNPKGW